MKQDRAECAIRDAVPEDADAVRAVYAPYVTDTVISFEDEVPSTAELRARMAASHRWLVAQDDAGQVIGYGYSAPFASRAAYRWSAEVSVYLAAPARGRGIGRSLISTLMQDLRERGIVNAFAGVALPNAASVGLFESLGFEQVATHRNVGFKHGRWIDVGWWQRQLPNDLPAEP